MHAFLNVFENHTIFNVMLKMMNFNVLVCRNCFYEMEIENDEFRCFTCRYRMYEMIVENVVDV